VLGLRIPAIKKPDSTASVRNMGIFRFPEIRISKCGNAFVLQLVRPNFLVYPTCASQADTGDKFFNFNRKHAVFAHFKIVF
jgi:hypothetical protein